LKVTEPLTLFLLEYTFQARGMPATGVEDIVVDLITDDIDIIAQGKRIETTIAHVSISSNPYWFVKFIRI
jgi:hypothetical protein